MNLKSLVSVKTLQKFYTEITKLFATKEELSSGLSLKQDKGSALQLGETSSTAYRGDRGKEAYDHSQAIHAPVDAQKNSDITQSEIENKLIGNITSHNHDEMYCSREEVNMIINELNDIPYDSLLAFDTTQIIFEGAGSSLGYIDSQNNIVLGEYLANDVYTLKYEMEDGTYMTIGSFEISEEEEDK